MSIGEDFRKAGDATRLGREAAQAPGVVRAQLGANDPALRDLAARLRQKPPRAVMTLGRGSFAMEMHHYDFVPALQQEKIITAAKAERGEEVEEEE